MLVDPGLHKYIKSLIYSSKYLASNMVNFSSSKLKSTSLYLLRSMLDKSMKWTFLSISIAMTMTLPGIYSINYLPMHSTKFMAIPIDIGSLCAFAYLFNFFSFTKKRLQLLMKNMNY